MMNDNTAPAATKPTLRERVQKWIDRNVPVHSRAEYEALLITNEKLAITLIAKCLDFEALLEAHYRLQEEATRGMAVPCFVASADMYLDPARMDPVMSVRWQIDPVRMNVAIPQWEVKAYGPGAVMEAYEEMFRRKVMPDLWKATERVIHKTFLVGNRRGV